MSLQRLPSKNSRPWMLVGLLVAVIVLMLFMGKCSRRIDNTGLIHPELHKSGGDTLDVAIELTPRLYMPRGDSITGLDYEIMTAICQRARRPVKFHPFAPLDYAVNGLEAGYFDVVISSLPSTSVLKERFSLTNEVYRDYQVLVQLKDTENFIKSPENLAGDTVWIAAGSPFSQRIANLSAESGEPIHIVEMEGRTAEHLVMLVARGEIPRAVVYAGIARRMKNDLYPELDINTPISFTQFQTWATAKSNTALTDTLNTWLDNFRVTPAYKAILTRY